MGTACRKRLNMYLMIIEGKERRGKGRRGKSREKQRDREREMGRGDTAAVSLRGRLKRKGLRWKLMISLP